MLRSRIVPFLQHDTSIIASVLSRNLHTSQFLTGKKKKKDGCDKEHAVAIILCGCGYLDGTDALEALSVAVHATQKGLTPKFFGPDIDICGVVDHFTKEPDSSTRNALVEAARLARSEIKPFCECSPCENEALFLPGGFGLVRTLSDFESKGTDCTINPELEKLIEDFHCDKKPIGALCIAPALVAKVLKGVKVTLGKNSPKDDWPHCEVIPKVKKMGAKIEMKDVKGVTRCKKYNVYSTPAWMYKCATYAEVFEGIGKLVTMMKKNMCQ